jgi:hypothetical protein
LGHDAAALTAVVEKLWYRPRDGYLLPLESKQRMQWLRARHNSIRLREVVLQELIRAGERNVKTADDPRFIPAARETYSVSSSHDQNSQRRNEAPPEPTAPSTSVRGGDALMSAEVVNLSDQDRQLIFDCLNRGEPLPQRFRLSLFADVPDVELKTFP